MSLSKISVKRPVAVTMVVCIFIVLGLYALSMLPLEMMPDMQLSYAMVITQYSNVGSEEVENLVTKTIESSVSSISGVQSMTSQSSEGMSLVMLEFSANMDMDQAVADIEDQLELIEAYLPEDASDPMVLKMDMNMMPAMMMSVSYEGYDMIQTKQYLEDNLRSRLESVDGVASVNVTGAQDRQIEIVIDPEKLFGYNMSLSDVVSAVAAQNQNLPAGTVSGMGKDMSVRTTGTFESTRDIATIPLVTSAGQVILLTDVASVQDTYSDHSSYARLNGENSISVTISEESDANTVDVVNGVISVLETMHENDPKFSYNITMEQGSYIEDAISGVAENAVSGALLAIAVLLLFLGSVRTSLVIGISMPISVITTFVGMYFAGMSLNVVSLGGLALGVGMLVDNSVVVLENIFRRRKECEEDAPTASVNGASEVLGAVVASVLTTCIVYVPLIFIDNMMAVMFKQLAFAIIFSQTASLLTTFLLVPMLSSRIQDTNRRNKYVNYIVAPFERFMNWMYGKYEKALRWVLRHRKSFVAVVLLTFVLSLFVLGQLGMTLMPDSDEGTLTVSVEMPQGTKLDDTDALVRQIEETVRQHEDVETVFAEVGSDSMSAITGGTSSNAASLTVTLREDRNKATVDVVEELRQSLKDLSGATITLAASNSTMSVSSDEVSFQFTGTDDEELEAFVLKAEEVLAGIDGVTETETSISERKPEIRINIDENKAARYGLNTATANSMVRQALGETPASTLKEGGSEYDIVVTYPDGYVKDYGELQNLRFKTYTGQWITLGDVADITVEQGYSTLQRIDQKRVITLTGKLYGTDMGTAKAAFEEALAEMGIPDGISESAAGTYEVMMDAMSSLFTAILLGILLMYMIMAAQFESLIQPLIILFTIPLAMIGVVLALVIARSPLSVIGCIGILMLMGIIVNNAILLIDFVNTIRKEEPDCDRTEALVRSGLTRIRPVLMTTVTSVLGFLPMALSTATGANMMQPLATVLIGGLGIGTVLTLLFIPVVYSIVDDKLMKHQKKREQKKAAEAVSR